MIVRVYNYEKLNLISKNDIDEVFDLIGVHVDLIGLALIEYVLMLELGENCI